VHDHPAPGKHRKRPYFSRNFTPLAGGGPQKSVDFRRARPTLAHQAAAISAIRPGIMEKIALFVTNITSFVTNIAPFVTKVALFVTKVAPFVTKVAPFVTNIVSLVTNIVSLVTNIASFVQNAARYTTLVQVF
jgi:phage-related minor tail protein